MAKEVAVVVALLLLYRLGRMLGRDESARAFDNAREVLVLEDRLGIDNELAVQRAVLDESGLIRQLNRYYASAHFAASMAFLVFVYVWAPKLVAHIRFLFVSVTATALVIHLVYPLAPPRMLDGYVDTIERYGPSIYDGQSTTGQMANQFAAMPSLHFGWAVLVAYGVVRALDARWRWLIVLHPTITLAAIVITANHYWLDALVALVLIGAALALERELTGGRQRPSATTRRRPPGSSSTRRVRGHRAHGSESGEPSTRRIGTEQPAMPIGHPPYIDEHAVAVSAGVDDVWPALLDALDGSFSRPGSACYARIVGCADSTASGPRPLAEGSTIPGFRVAVADPGRELVLVGDHHFSSYQLTFRLEPLGPGRSELRAESRAAFPGLAGRAYRLLVISSGIHVRTVRSMISAVGRGAQQRARTRA